MSVFKSFCQQQLQKNISKPISFSKWNIFQHLSKSACISLPLTEYNPNTSSLNITEMSNTNNLFHSYFLNKLQQSDIIQVSHTPDSRTKAHYGLNCKINKDIIHSELHHIVEGNNSLARPPTFWTTLQTGSWNLNLESTVTLRTLWTAANPVNLPSCKQYYKSWNYGWFLPPNLIATHLLLKQRFHDLATEQI